MVPFELLPSGIDRALSAPFPAGGGIEDGYPLTPVQEGMLFHTLVDPEAGNYIEQFTCRVRGDIDIPRYGNHGSDWSRGTQHCGPRFTGPSSSSLARLSIDT